MLEKLGNASGGQETKVGAGAHRWWPGARGTKVGPWRIDGGRDVLVEAGTCQ